MLTLIAAPGVRAAREVGAASTDWLRSRRQTLPSAPEALPLTPPAVDRAAVFRFAWSAYLFIHHSIVYWAWFRLRNGAGQWDTDDTFPGLLLWSVAAITLLKRAFSSAESLRLSFEHRPICLTVTTKDHRMSRPNHEVNDVGVRGDDCGQRADDRFNALVRAEQSEGEQHTLPGHPKVGLQDLLVTRLHFGYPVRDNMDLRPLYAVGAGEQIRGDSAHHH